MIPDALKTQLHRWLDDDLPESDVDRLQQTLEETPDLLHALADLALLHQMLAKTVLAAPHPLAEPAADTSQLKPGRWPVRTAVCVCSAVAACLLLCAQLVSSSAVASPADVVRRSLARYQPGLDRCYTVHVQPEERLRRLGLRRRAVQPQSTLWVRDQRFLQVFGPPGQQLVWGRNAQGAVWFTNGGDSAAVFEADEVPDMLRELCDLRTLQLPTLLQALLQDYELKWSHAESGLHTILAQPRLSPADSRYGAVEIQIEADTHLVRDVVMERLQDGRIIAALNFSLQDLRPQQDSLYEIQTHLQRNAVVLDRTSRAGSRAELLRGFLQQLRTAQPVQRGLGLD
ncbi:MAG: hypothetical protein ACKO2P_21585 [Planctomycetota bacterium]